MPTNKKTTEEEEEKEKEEDEEEDGDWVQIFSFYTWEKRTRREGFLSIFELHKKVCFPPSESVGFCLVELFFLH